MADRHRLQPDQRIDLHKAETRADDFCSDRTAAEAEFETLRSRMIELQARLYAEGRHSLLVILQALDAGGKDGTIRKVFRGVNPQGVHVASFKGPTPRELAHDFLWRIHRQTPAAGTIGVFNRSHYEDVLIVRVDNLVPEKVWRPRYRQINQFEKLLVDNGTTILKFYLHISRKEQRKRFQARLDDPSKHWKFSREDIDKRAQWDDYLAAYQEMLIRCTTGWAPWHVIPADQKWYRNLAIARTIVAALEQMNPQYPTNDDDYSDVVIPK